MRRRGRRRLRVEAGRWQSSRQLVLVTVADWNADHGTLRTFTRGRHGWVAAGVTAPVTIGRGGAGWGLGLNAPLDDGPVKHEGDSRSPAGVFRIGQVFGYAATQTPRCLIARFRDRLLRGRFGCHALQPHRRRRTWSAPLR